MSACRPGSVVSKTEIWRQVAVEIGGVFHEQRGFWGKDVLIFKHGKWRILLHISPLTTATGFSTDAIICTRIRVLFRRKDGFCFRMHRAGFFSAISRLFGIKHFEIGEPSFDDQFIIEGNNPEKLKLLFATNEIKELVQRQPSIHFGITDEKHISGASFPEEVDELYFWCVGVIVNPELLKSLFELFSTVLTRLVEIDSAYQDGPSGKLAVSGRYLIP